MASNELNEKSINNSEESGDMHVGEKNKVEYSNENVGGAKRKRTHATMYEEKEANKNPSGYSKLDVYGLIKDGSVVPGSPPKNKNCSSEVWSNGIRFLYTKATIKSPRKEVQNWFYCIKDNCDWLYNGHLKNGTAALRRHYKKHLVDPPYIFSREQLAMLLANATSFGSSSGSVSESMLTKILPKADKWLVNRNTELR